MCWGARQRIDRRLSKLRCEAIVNMFLYQSWYLPKEEETSFFSDFFVWNLEASVEPRRHRSFTKDFFSFLDRVVFFLSCLGLFLFLFLSLFFTKDFLPLLIFSRAKIFPKTKTFHLWIICKVRDVKYGNNIASLPRKFLRGLAQVRDYDTFPIYSLLFEITFF